MKQIHKEYQHPFLLEPTKLTRLVELIHDRLAELPHKTASDHFEVTLSGKRTEEMTTIDDVLALENSRKHKIKRLLIISSAGTEGAARPEHEIQVEFGGHKPDGRSKIIAVSVRSDNAGWASRTLSEIEEQVERTWLQYMPSILMLLGLVVVLGLLVLQIIPLGFRIDRVQTMWLQGDDLDRVEKILNQGDAITDDEMREIMSMQLKNVLAIEKSKQSPPKMQSSHWIFLGALAVVLVCVITLMATCYPTAVFLWGDEVERHTEMLRRRHLAWSIIVGVMFVGVFSKSVYESVTSLLR